MKAINTYIRRQLLKLADKIFEKYGIVPPYRIPLRDRTVAELHAEHIFNSEECAILRGEYGKAAACRCQNEFKQRLIMLLQDAIIQRDLIEFYYIMDRPDEAHLRARLRILRPDSIARLDNIYPMPNKN